MLESPVGDLIVVGLVEPDALAVPLTLKDLDIAANRNGWARRSHDVCDVLAALLQFLLGLFCVAAFGCRVTWRVGNGVSASVVSARAPSQVGGSDL